MNDYQKSMVKTYGFTSYTSHFDSTKRFVFWLSILFLVISCMAVAKYIEGYFSGLGDVAFTASLILAGALGLFVHDSTNKLLVYFNNQKMIEPVLGTLVGGALILTILADFNGSVKWAYNIVGEAPTDVRTSELGSIYTPQIEVINSEITDIEGKNFYWCATHSAAHKCASAQYYVDPKADKKHVQKIEELKAQRTELQGTMNSLLSDAGAQHKSKVGEYESELGDRKSGLRFVSLFCTIGFLLSTKWLNGYGTRFVAELNTPNTADKTANTARTAKASPYTAGNKLRAVYANKASRVSRVKATKQPFSTAEMATAGNVLEEQLAKDNRALREELNALKEMEEAKRASAKKP